MNIPEKSFYADSMAFIGLQGQPPLFVNTGRPQLALAHVTSVPPMVKDAKAVLETHTTFVKAALSNLDVCLVRTTEDLSSNNLRLLCGMQHAPAGLTLADLNAFHSAGVRTMALAYDGATEYGGGFKAGGRLTGRGEKLIEWMTRVGVILDLSHSSHQTAMGALTFIQQERLRTKVMLSHTACYSIYPHERNARDDLLEAIVETDGHVGLPLISFYLGKAGSNPLTEYTRHLSHALSVTGRGRVGIGSDCNHLNMTMEQAREHFDRMVAILKTGGTFGEYFPDRPPELIEHGSAMFRIIEYKLRTGNTLVLDEGILGQNFYNFLLRSLPQA